MTRVAPRARLQRHAESTRAARREESESLCERGGGRRASTDATRGVDVCATLSGWVRDGCCDSQW
eukprot:5022840-Pleurochrysis_carterae.AAC.1